MQNLPPEYGSCVTVIFSYKSLDVKSFIIAIRGQYMSCLCQLKAESLRSQWLYVTGLHRSLLLIENIRRELNVIRNEVVWGSKVHRK